LFLAGVSFNLITDTTKIRHLTTSSSTEQHSKLAVLSPVSGLPLLKQELNCYPLPRDKEVLLFDIIIICHTGTQVVL